MKRNVLILTGAIAIALVVLSQCQKPQKPLFFNENGNYVVDNNFIIKEAKAMSAADVQALIELDAEYAKLTDGTRFICYVINRNQIQRIQKFQTAQTFDRLTRFDKIQKILDIHKGCFEVQHIDWAVAPDIKARFESIVSKYSPAMLEGGDISIQNNNIATSVAQLQAQDMQNLLSRTVIGANYVDICGDYMGVRAFTRWLTRLNNSRFDSKLNKELVLTLQKYK
ncbi:MAG: hypothetical protein ACK4NS_13200 [Saprospiraceae bacterium]